MKKSEYITFRTEETTKKYLEEIAHKEDRTLSYIINRIIKEQMQKNEKDSKP